MLLAVDVGNTQTHLGAFDGDELGARLAPGDPSERHGGRARRDRLAPARSSRDSASSAIDGAIVSTVVPQLGPEYEALCERHIGGPCLIVGPTVKTGMPILVDNPHELGADRLVNAVAAHAKVDGACVAVDFGTSTNFDVVSGAGEYLGGVIGPGVEISMEALTSRTAKLPRIDLSAPEGAIGKHTQAAIQSGFAYGFAGLVDGINRRLAEELGEQADLHRHRRPRADDRPALRDDRRGRPAADPARPAPDLRAQHLGRTAAARSHPRSASATSRSPTASCSRRWPGSATGSSGCRPAATAPAWRSPRWSRASASTTATSARCGSCFACTRTSTRSPSSSSARTPR